MSSTVNKLLDKTVSSLYVSTHDDDDGDLIETTGIASSALISSRALVFPSPNFKLDEKEDAFLRDMIYNHKLFPNLSLLDLLFYDLHSELTKLKHCMRPEDFDKALLALENCYANAVEDSFEVEAMQDFLKTLILNVIVSNNKLRQPTQGSVGQVKAVGDTKLITATLHERVQLFQKFAAVFVNQPWFMNHTLALLGGNERLVAQGNSDFHLIFRNNSEFLEVALRALSRTNNRVNANKEYFLSVVKKIKTLSDPLADRETRVAILHELTMITLLSIGDTSPCMTRIFYNSFIACPSVLMDTIANFESTKTEASDRAFQAGKPPTQTGRSREPLDPKDRLSELKVDHLIEPYFHLTDAESALFQELFETTHLDSNMTTFDILGYALQERLGKLKEIRPQFSDRITRSQDLLAAYCLRFSVGLQRSTPEWVQNLGAVNDFTRLFAYLPDEFLAMVDTELRKLQEFVEAARIEGKKPSPGQLKNLKDSKHKILEQITQTIIPIRKLFGKLLQCKGHFYLLLQSAAYLQGYEPLDRPNEAGRAAVQRYFGYVKNGYQTGIKEKLLGATFDFDKIMDRDLPFSASPTEKEMIAFGTKMAAALYKMSYRFDVAASELEEATSQGLDHQTWLARKNMKSRSVNKIPEQFREQLFSNFALTASLRAFLADMLRLVERRVYPEGTITTEACAFRLVHNMRTYRQMKETGGPTPASSLSRPTSSKFKAILDRIEGLFTQNKKIFEFSINDEDMEAGTFNHGAWLGHLYPIEDSVTALFDQSLEDLKVLKEELIQELKTKWSALSFEELQKVDVPAKKEELFQEGLHLMRPIWILSDMLALLQKRHYTGKAAEAAIIPQELADVMELDELDGILQKLIQDKTPVPPEPGAVKAAIEMPIAAPLLAPQAEKPILDQPKKAPPVKKQPEKKAVPAKAPTVVPSAPAVPENVKALAKLTKSEHILERLEKEMNFSVLRVTGSHKILKGPKGGRVVVPKNSNLPRGTRNEIVRQTAEALQN